MMSRQQLDVFCNDARQLGVRDVVVVSPPKQVFTATWVRLRCQYGCSEYGQCLTCPPYAPTPETTRHMLDEYQAGLLLHGHDWKSLREMSQTLERQVFLTGYYKAFAYLCGPCWRCKTCVVLRPKGGITPPCRHPELARPSMEAAGIDVFATARAAGLPIEVVRLPKCQANHFTLVLIE